MGVIIKISLKDLVLLLFLILIYKPSLAIIAVGHLIGSNKLNMSEVFSPLGYDACDFSWPKHINLQPLRLIAVSRCPGIDLPLLIQSCFTRLPGEHVHVESSEDAGSRNLVVLNVTRLHPHRLRTPCELTAQELHTKSAVSPAHLRVYPHILSFDWRGEGVGKWGVVINISTENYIFVRALDFVRPPRLSVIAVGHFVRLNIFRAPDALGSLGYHSCHPHPSLEINLNPGPSVILGCSPSIHQTFLIQPGKIRIPFLKSEESSVSGGGCNLLVGDYSTFHAQWTRTFVLTVSSHIFPWAFTGIVCNQICADTPIFTRVPFAFINIVLAVDSIEAWWALADISNKCVPPVCFTDFTGASIVTGIWMARSLDEMRDSEL